MKLLTSNFLSCPLKSCRTSPDSFPLHFKDAELAQDVELEYSSDVFENLIKRVEWDALVTCAGEIGFVGLEKPRCLQDDDEDENEDEGMEVDGGNKGGKGGKSEMTEQEKQEDEEKKRKLWEVVMQTQVVSGKLVCRSCGYEFEIREGIVNFLLPGHLV